MNEKILRTEEISKDHLERADRLQSRCADLDKKVADLMRKLAENEANHIKEKHAVDAAVQTDRISKVPCVQFGYNEG